MEKKKIDEENIDCSLVKSADGRYISPRAGAFFLHFAGNRRDGVLFTLSKQGHAIFFRYRKNPFLPFPQPAVAEGNSAVCGHVRYKAIKKDIDLDYTVTGNGVKQIIVVKKKRRKYRFSFCLQTTKGLAVSHDREACTVIITDARNGEPVFTVPAPTVYGAAQGFSDAVAYDLKLDKDGYLFSVEVDPRLIHDEKRVLPVYISFFVLVM